MNLPAGYRVGPYEIDREISRGSHAVVFRAWQRNPGRWVALKVLRHREPTLLAAFRREIRLTGSLGHGGVRAVYDAGETPDGYPFLAMQYVDTSLREVMRRRESVARPFSCGEVVRYLARVASVLDYVHRQGLVHLDIKPENILVFADGRVVLADFGSACPTGTTTHEGTPRYLSPEQAAADRPVGPRSDVYSLACVAYEMLAGEPPFGGDIDAVLLRQHAAERPRPLRQVVPGLPRAAERAIEAGLAKDPRKRPARAGRLLQHLRQGAHPKHTVSDRGIRRGAARPPGIRGLAIVGSIALVALMIVVALIIVSWLAGWPSPARMTGASHPQVRATPVVPLSGVSLACVSALSALVGPAITRATRPERAFLERLAALPDVPEARTHHFTLPAVALPA